VQDAFEVREMRHRSLSLPVGREQIDRKWSAQGQNDAIDPVSDIRVTDFGRIVCAASRST
jgi:hypothetical protein